MSRRVIQQWRKWKQQWRKWKS